HRQPEIPRGLLRHVAHARPPVVPVWHAHHTRIVRLCLERFRRLYVVPHQDRDEARLREVELLRPLYCSLGELWTELQRCGAGWHRTMPEGFRLSNNRP